MNIQLRDMVKRFGTLEAVSHVSLDIQDGELFTLLGPSGCGKTTILRLIGGFHKPDGGEIYFGGREVSAIPPYERNIGMVFQNYALWPHMTIFDNVAYGLKIKKTPRAQMEERVNRALYLVHLTGLEKRYPGQLSGGQQQRVALARALAIHPRLLLLDEPLSNLDAALRQEMAREIRILQQSGGITTIMVTHDQTEAMALADRLVVMHEGCVQQIGTPEQVHSSPANPFVARFIGGSNIVAGRLNNGRLALADGMAFALANGYADKGPATLAVLPDSMRLVPPGCGLVDGEVELCTWLGAVVEHAVRISPNLTLLARGAGLGADATRRHTAGTRVALRWEAEDERLFDAQGRVMQAVSRETSHA